MYFKGRLVIFYLNLVVLLVLGLYHQTACAQGETKLETGAELVTRTSASSALNRALNALAGASKNAYFAVLDLDSPNIISQHQANSAVKPASILKLLTSSVVLSELSPQHRFYTEFLLHGSERRKRELSAIYVRGAGDPSFTIENLWLAIRKIKRMGVRSIEKVVLDDSLFESSRSAKGQRAFEAGASALSFNFNSIAFEVCPGEAIGKPAQIVSDPFELDLPFVGKIETVSKHTVDLFIDQDRSRLSYRVGGKIGLQTACKTFYRSVSNPALYLGAALKGLLRSNGVTVGSTPEIGLVPAKAEPFWRNESKALSSIVWDLNNFSNNFIAEQLIFALGQGRQQPQLSHELGLEVLARYLVSLGFDRKTFNLEDGSGLSHQNQVSAMMIAVLLKDTFKNQAVAPEFLASLPVGGRSGTLKNRDMDFPDSIVRAKTGSLNDVSSLAGYVVNRRGKRYAFALIQNKVDSRSAAHRIEEKFVKLLAQG